MAAGAVGGVGMGVQFCGPPSRTAPPPPPRAPLQGVLLLNSVLTVRAHAPASHAKRGWEAFTDAVRAHPSPGPVPLAALSLAALCVVCVCVWVGGWGGVGGGGAARARHSRPRAARPQVIAALSARRRGVVFLLWGRYAQVHALVHQHA